MWSSAAREPWSAGNLRCGRRADVRAGAEVTGRRGRQVEITSTGGRRVSFDLLDFYHNESRLFGVDTRKRNAIASAALLDAITPFFEAGTFQPPMIDRTIPLADRPAAYAQVASGEARSRLVLCRNPRSPALYLSMLGIQSTTAGNSVRMASVMRSGG